MKKIIFTVLLIVCITAMSACAVTEVLPPHLTREDGVLYLDIWSDDETGCVNTGDSVSSGDNSLGDVNASDPDVEDIWPEVKFESIEDAIYRIYNNDFTEEQLKELAQEKRDEFGRIEIFDVKWFAKMPAVRDLPLTWVVAHEGDASVGYYYKSIADRDIQCSSFSMRFHSHTDITELETIVKEEVRAKYRFDKLNGPTDRKRDVEYCYVQEECEYRGFPAKVETHLATSYKYSLSQFEQKLEWVRFYSTYVTYTAEINGAVVNVYEVLNTQEKTDLSDENYIVEYNKEIHGNWQDYLNGEFEKLLKYQTLEDRIPKVIYIQYYDEERDLKYLMRLSDFEEVPSTEWILNFAIIE